MRLSDDFDDRNNSSMLVSMALGVFAFVAVLIGAVIFMNWEPTGRSGAAGGKRADADVSEDGTEDPASARNEDGADPYLPGRTLTSDELDFWHMYDETESAEKEEAERKKEQEEEQEADPSTDGKHTRLVSDDGTEEWVSINPYLTKNTYDASGLVYQYPIMKYYEDSERVSHVGVHVSSEDGDVNFGRLKKAGVDFAMIRIGSRGYGSGNLMSDDMFYENVRKATEAGMDIGVTFFSQAVTTQEALEEAQRVIEGLQGFTVVYPVAFDMEYVKNDTARVQGLSRDAKTEIATVFLDAVADAGYKTILYGDKEWLIRRVDLTKLIGYDVWLSQEQDAPDYPYQYTMWEYTKSAKIDGMEEPAHLSVCMIDYESK